MNEPRSKGAKSVAVMVSAGAAVLILCLAGVAAISAPKFMRFQDRSRQSECKGQLRALATAERAFFAEHDRYTTKPAELGYSPEPGNRYQYRLGPLPDEAISVDTRKHPDAVPALLDAAIPPGVQAKLGLQGCPACELTVTCAGNVDDDPAIDVWSITLGVQQEGGASSAVAGFPVNLVDDTQQ